MCGSRMKAVGTKVKSGGEARPESRRVSLPHTSRGKTAVFLGGGRITGALLAGLRLAGYEQPIVVYDRHPEKLRRLHREYGVTVERVLRRAIEQADLLIIAVRPDAVRDLLQQIKASAPGRINPGKTNPAIVISLAAGIPLASLRGWLSKPLDKPPGKPMNWARAMPSPVARSGHGLTALTFGRDFSRCRATRCAQFLRSSWSDPRNPREPIRCFQRDLLLQPRLPRAFSACGGRPDDWTGSQDGHDGRSARSWRRNSGVARRVNFIGRLAAGSGYSRAAWLQPRWQRWINRGTGAPYKKGFRRGWTGLEATPKDELSVSALSMLLKKSFCRPA